MNQLPPAIDLKAVRTELVAASAMPELADAIRRALVAQSCLSDLKQAADACDALEMLLPSPRGVGTARRESTETSLLTTSVLLYARATSTSGQRGERGSIQITAKLTAEQSVDHDAIVEVRNRALAHVYPDELVAGTPWHRGVALLVQHGSGWLPGTASNRVQLDRILVGRLSRQIPVAITIVAATSKRRLNQIASTINRNIADPLLQQIVDKSGLDLIAVFGSLAVARQAVAAMDGGSHTFRG